MGSKLLCKGIQYESPNNGGGPANNERVEHRKQQYLRTSCIADDDNTETESEERGGRWWEGGGRWGIYVYQRYYNTKMLNSTEFPYKSLYPLWPSGG